MNCVYASNTCIVCVCALVLGDRTVEAASLLECVLQMDHGRGHQLAAPGQRYMYARMVFTKAIEGGYELYVFIPRSRESRGDLEAGVSHAVGHDRVFV